MDQAQPEQSTKLKLGAEIPFLLPGVFIQVNPSSAQWVWNCLVLPDLQNLLRVLKSLLKEPQSYGEIAGSCGRWSRSCPWTPELTWKQQHFIPEKCESSISMLL